MSANRKTEQLTLFAEGLLKDPASLPVVPGSEEAQKMTVGSGRKLLELLPKSGQGGAFSRTLLEYLVCKAGFRSSLCYLTWKPKVTKQQRLLFRLAPLTPPISDKGYSFWPTPAARDYRSPNKNGNFKYQLQNVVGGRLNPEWVRCLMGFPPGWLDIDGPLPTDANSTNGSRREQR